MEEDDKREWLHDAIKIFILLWSMVLLSCNYIKIHDKKILDFDSTFIASIFSTSAASLGLKGIGGGRLNGSSNGNGNGHKKQ
jgi:hypothetical protein